MRPVFYISDDSFSIAQDLAVRLEQWVHEAGEAPFHIALSGGSTPRLFFDLLAARDAHRINWTNLHFWWGDERCVSPEDKESNYRWAKELLLDPLHIPEQNIHRIHGEDDPRQEALRYGSELKETLPLRERIPVFDLIILGMGEDGHTASIFPDQLNLIDSKDCCAVATHPQSGQKRVTLTGKVINAAQRVAFLVSGLSKAEKVKIITDRMPGSEACPAAHVEPADGSLYWFIDRDAALFLSLK